MGMFQPSERRQPGGWPLHRLLEIRQRLAEGTDGRCQEQTCLFFECQLDYQYISDTIHSCHGLDIKWIETAVLLEICPRMYTIVLQRSHITGYELDVQKNPATLLLLLCVLLCLQKIYRWI